jgi:rubrerythrin
VKVAHDFIDDLLDKINFSREEAPEIDRGIEKQELFSTDIIKHWLHFAVYYERAAVSFIGEWMRSIEEVDALKYFSHQIEDECNHFRWLNHHLVQYGGDFASFKAPKEWKFLMEEYYPGLDTLIGRLAAHNIAAETGALGFLEYGLNRFPKSIKETVTKVIKDERYHVAFGIKLLRRYCITDEQKALAQSTALESLQYMQRAREVFVFS